MLLSALGDEAFAYDLVTQVLHRLSGPAGLLLAACDGETDFVEVGATWSRAVGNDPASSRNHLIEALESFTTAGLIGRGHHPELPIPTPVRSRVTPTGPAGPSYRVLDWRIEFHSNEPEYLEAVVAQLGPPQSDHGGELVTLSLVREPDGWVSVESETQWRFVDLESCSTQLGVLMDDYAMRATTCAALHAGAVRSPAGQVVLLPAAPDAGKSTLTGAFLAAGWDYLGDEIIGVRPGSMEAIAYPKRLRLDATSRSVLGLGPGAAAMVEPTEIRASVDLVTGEAGPIAVVVLPAFSAGAETEASRLDSIEALHGLIANTFNLDSAGDVALDALCDLAERAPIYRLVHGDARRAVDRVTALL